MSFNEEKALFAVHIGSLLLKSADKQPLTEEERKVLEEWRQSSPQRSEIYRQAMDHQAVADELRELNGTYDPDRAVKNIFAALQMEPVADPAAPNAAGKRSYIGRWAAAAAVLILVAAGWYFSGTKQDVKGPVAVSPKQQTVKEKEIQPAANRAILTLSNGSSIALDSARNGRLAKQGGVTIDNTDGILTYRGDGNEGSIVYNTISTPRGGQYQLNLPDGSKVWLNAASSLKYPTAFTGSERTVELIGEAYFEVAPDKLHPFNVSTRDMRISVLGTQFDVTAYSDEDSHRAILVEGAVSVSNGAESRMLRPGEQAIVKDKDMVTGVADVEKAIAWRTGFFAFSNTDIRALMREVSRWYDIDVAYGITDFSKLYGGRISRRLSLHELTKLLESSGIHHYRLDGRKLLVLP